MRRTTAFERIAAMTGALRILQGGTSAGKTFAVMQYLIALAEQRHNKIITVISDTLPALKQGAMRDLKRILRDTNHQKYFDVNKTDNIWTCRSTGTIIEFTGMEDELKARGGRRDYLFINEANRIRFEVFEQLYARTSGFTIVDFNPSERFWAHREAEKDYASLEILTYKDNEELDAKTIEFIESHDRNGNWWKVYGLGQIGELEGNVFSGWEFVNELPAECELLAYGLDFGFSPDPCALVSLWRTDGKYVARQEFVKHGLLAEGIIAAVAAVVEPEVPIVCDHARPEIIADMQDKGLSAVPCIKNEKINGETVGRLGQINRMAEEKFIAIGKELEQEYLTYSHKQNRQGDFLNEIAKGQDNLIDALRYAWYWIYKDVIMQAAIDARIKEYGL